jgi:molybdenum cofactor cytidylyltransferase
MPIPAIVLAAGRSTRMGRAKATLPIDDRDTFLNRIVRTFRDAGVDDVVVVLGHEAEEISAALNDCAASDVSQDAGRVAQGFSPAYRIVVNANYDRGQLSSLQAGLAAVDRPGVNAILMTLVDVPLVSASTVRAVLDRYRATGAPVVRPVSGARHGHPILIARTLFDALRRADAETGAKPIVRAHASLEGDVAVDDEGAFTDIDTMAEYERVIGGAADRRRGSSSR